MESAHILDMRLRSQLIEGSSAAGARDVASHLLAVQAQDYYGAVWALGLRVPGSTMADIEDAIARREIVRTWPMRGTLHFVAREDVRWLLALLTPRVIARAKKREQQLALHTKTFSLAGELLSDALAGGRSLTRPDALVLLESGGIATDGQRGYHILWRLSQEGLLVVGPMQDKQQTFGLLDEWLPVTRADTATLALSREESLALLASRYIAGHGPATVGDLARWADITKREAAAAIAAVDHTLESARHEGATYWFEPGLAPAPRSGSPRLHLLPGFDEYMLGYVGRAHQLGAHLDAYGSRVAANGMLAPTVVLNGRAVGVWKRTLRTRSVSFETTEFEPLPKRAQAALVREQQSYARFVGREVRDTRPTAR